MDEENKHLRGTADVLNTIIDLQDMKSNGNMCNAGNLGSHDDGTTAAQQVAMEASATQTVFRWKKEKLKKQEKEERKRKEAETKAEKEEQKRREKELRESERRRGGNRERGREDERRMRGESRRKRGIEKMKWGCGEDKGHWKKYHFCQTDCDFL
ncbi:hypothetical protein J4Q44_G00369960 [Coregonus suidteri]|uniref:Uncharacterized protein n=1 Tax=Coregonus suidteri TaxID=861788 RepID=A0AAN8KH84_9TELE